MKNILLTSILFVFSFLLFSCNNDDKEILYSTKFHTFGWDVDSVPVIISSSALNQTFQIKDGNNKFGGIKGMPCVYAKSLQDTVIIYNTGLNADLKNSIISDTIRGAWFTIINQEERGVRVILDKNEETKTRYLEILVWVYSLNTHDGVPHCDPLIIHQLPSKNK